MSLCGCTHMCTHVQKLPYNPEEGDEFEAAWLLLANIHLGAGKLELAKDVCDMTLSHNASSDRALSLKGACAEASGDFQVPHTTILSNACYIVAVVGCCQAL
jgi:hypothetical protein